MIYTIISAVAAFIATNIDDLFINILLYVRSSGKKEDLAITAGKFTGTALLLAISCFGAAGLQKLAADWLWLLGFIPIILGVKEAAAAIKNAEDSDISYTGISSSPLTNSTLITLASGADNIGVYLPLMARFDFWQMGLTALVFFIMTGLFCTAGRYLAITHAVKDTAGRYRKRLIPAVYILLGLYIIFM